MLFAVFFPLHPAPTQWLPVPSPLVSASSSSRDPSPVRASTGLLAHLPRTGTGRRGPLGDRSPELASQARLCPRAGPRRWGKGCQRDTSETAKTSGGGWEGGTARQAGQPGAPSACGWPRVPCRLCASISGISRPGALCTCPLTPGPGAGPPVGPERIRLKLTEFCAPLISISKEYTRFWNFRSPWAISLFV